MILHGPDILLVVLIALATDALIGDPDAIWRRVPHPVAWIGALISRLDRSLNHEDDAFARRKATGVAALAVVIAVSGTIAWLLERALAQLPLAPLWTGLLASILIAQRSLYDHVARVSKGFAANGIAGGRRAVSMIVGRDPDSLDEAGICRAAIESSAENFSDGVVAPVFWLVLFGLPGLVIYKAVNTADSMIGHKSPRFLAFGWASARLDDLLNLAPARLAGLLVALGAITVRASPSTSLAVMWRDARLHRSPNAGWPEAAMAGVLGLALAGPRRYASGVVDDPYLNADARREAKPRDIDRALKIMLAACGFGWGLVVVLMLVTSPGFAQWR
jgi:adenosylcobinamide-phosphate synthase